MIKQLLREVPLFQSLDDAQLELFEELGNIRTFPRNTLIISEGDDSGSLYVVIDGKLKVYLSDDEGKEVILGFEGAGGCIGEIGLLDSEPRSASVVTMVKSKCLVISKEAFLGCVRNNPDAAVGVILGLTKRVRSLLENVKSLALSNVYRRVVGTITNMAEREGDVWVTQQKLTHQEIADMVGASREMVSRILRDLTTGGYISMENRIIVIHRKPPSGW